MRSFLVPLGLVLAVTLAVPAVTAQDANKAGEKKILDDLIKPCDQASLPDDTVKPSGNAAILDNTFKPKTKTKVTAKPAKAAILDDLIKPAPEPASGPVSHPMGVGSIGKTSKLKAASASEACAPVQPKP